jgi:hypothetical protein
MTTPPVPRPASKAHRLAACQTGHSTPTIAVTIRCARGEVFSDEAVAGLLGQRITVTHPAVAGGSVTGTVASARLTPGGAELEIETS